MHFKSDKEKVPSAILYSHKNDENPAWGYGVPFEDPALRWFKLLLVDEKDLPDKVLKSPQVLEARALLEKKNKTPIEVVGDYLRHVWKHSRESIVRSLGKRMAKASLLQFVVTLPAIWPHYTRVRMREALQHAGILQSTTAGETSLSFIQEPEAAALTCLEENSDRADVSVGDHFIVCDAGGGTVDIITYTVLRLDPLTVGESDLCGAMFLDENFLELLKKIIPRDIQSNMQENALQKIMAEDWEHGIKPSVCKSSTSWDVQVPYNHKPIQPKINIKGSMVRDVVYQPVIAKIQALVAGQISQVKEHHRKVPKFIILVGGFGKSQYLYECLQDRVGDQIDVFQDEGEGPWTAVTRGAVLHGLAQTKLTNSISVAVDSRISRFSYGTLVNILPFDKDDHDSKDRVYCEEHQEFLAVEQTSWHVEIVGLNTPSAENVSTDKLNAQGEAVSAYDPTCFDFWQDLTSPEQDIEVEIVISDATKPPHRKDNTVKSLDGKVFRRMTYSLRMISDGSSLDFAIYYKNRRIGSQGVSFDTTSSSADPGRARQSLKTMTHQTKSIRHSGVVCAEDSDTAMRGPSRRGGSVRSVSQKPKVAPQPEPEYIDSDDENEDDDDEDGMSIKD
ncbi:hypothetical protein FZEAL_10639 [Fusarium zealandicum]|uniref:Actin-like ATPase domain-containing protein n=1 Tax=Fusarium zealandicum TaxID=1053134 RepID=A0A8H4X9R9_9HYPO|nr:hypothetical protein FZEAL_10639 [Fusarium zealandicum]